MTATRAQPERFRWLRSRFGRHTRPTQSAETTHEEIADPHSRERTARIVLLHLLLLTATCAIVFPLNRQMLFLGFDGAYFKNQIRQQAAWMPRRLEFGGTPFQGLGNIYFGNNFRFQPAVGISWIMNRGRVSPTTIYTIISCELFLSVLLLARSFRAGMFPALLAAWLAVLLIMPFVAPPPLYIISWLAPTMMEFFALQWLAAALFGWIGRGSLLRSLWLGLSMALILLLMLCTLSMALVLTAPALLVVCTLQVLWSHTARERWLKLACLAGLLLLAAPTALPFLAGMILYTVPGMLGHELLNANLSLSNVSILFHRSEGWFGPVLAVLGVGASLRLLLAPCRSHRAACRSHRAAWRSHRAVGLATLTLFALIVGGGLCLTFYFTQYDGPVMLYFEFAVWPLYCITAALGAAPLLASAIRWLQPPGRYFTELVPRVASRTAARWFGNGGMGGRILGAAGSPAVLLLPALAIAWALPDGAHLPNHMIWPHPPRRNALVNHLERDIALRPGAPYRGSVATFTGYADLPNGIAWLDQHNYDSQLQTALGNDMRAIGLWRYDIPTLFEYNQLITPTFHLMITRKLARPGDQQVRNVVVLSKVDVDYLASIGVRFVIADNEEPLQQGAKLRESIELADGAAVRLFEIDRPNLGDYSPTQVILARDAAEAVSLLDDDFDYRRSVVLHAPWPDSLVAAGFSELRPERNGLRLKASSRATSLLLLPLQYSHCLDLDVVRGDAARVRLVRANLMQAAVVFSGDVELLLSFRYGPFANPYGRIADYLDVKRLKIAEVPLPRACPRETRTDGHHPSDENLSPSEIGNDAHQTARATPMASAEKPDLHAKH